MVGCSPDGEDGVMQTIILSADWTPEGRKFSHIGSHKEHKLHMQNNIFPNEKYGFNGREFTITTNMVRMCSIPLLKIVCINMYYYILGEIK